MLQFLYPVFALVREWNHPFWLVLGACAITLMTYRGYRNLKHWFEDNERHVLYALTEAVYLPFLAFVWIVVLRLIYSLLPIRTLDFIFNIEGNLALEHISMLMLVTWFMMRFITSMQRGASLEYMRQPKLMTFLFRLFYYMLVTVSYTHLTLPTSFLV